jgi:membrane protein
MIHLRRELGACFAVSTPEEGSMANPWYDAFKPRALWHLLKEAASDWSRDRAPRLGAALAYYTVFSIVPLLIVIIALIGLFFGQDAAQSAIM